MYLLAKAIAFRCICFEIILETKSLVQFAVASEDQRARGRTWEMALIK